MTERKITVDCAHCANPFEVIPSRFKHGRGRHCSPACQYGARRAQPKTGRLTLTCIGCGSSFQRSRSLVNRQRGGGKYCTRECRDTHWRGPLNPNWQNGSGVYKRGSNWYAIRRKILKRDSVCQHCGSGGKLHIHHKIPFRMFEDENAANAETNLIALCPPCHRKEDARSKWVSFEGGALCLSAGGVAWQMAREKGLI